MSIPFLDLQAVNRMHGDEILAAIEDAARSGWYLHGEQTEAFEREYADYIGTRHAIACANGLDALTLILRAYIELGRLHKGDEVIVPANTFIASVLAITDNGLVPVFVEPSTLTLGLDDSLVESRISARTRAVMLVHLYGRCAYSAQIGELCKRHNLLLIEDNAQAHGCKFQGRRTGSLGHAAGHSFYPGKNLGAMGDAGCVTTDDDELADLIRSIANYGMSRKYVCDFQGRNSRIDEIQAAVLRVKLRHLDADNGLRRQIADCYYRLLPTSLLPPRMDDAANVYHLFPVFCASKGQRDSLQQQLAEQGVQTIIHYPIPPHCQACYRQFNTLSLSITEQMADTELSLPIGPAMTVDEAMQVCSIVALAVVAL